MNKIQFIVILIAILMIAGAYMVVARKKPVGQAPAVPADAQPAVEGIYTVDPSTSIVRWEGRKPLLANYTDRGTLGIASGSLSASNGKGSGTIIFDMNAISVGSTGKGAMEAALERHLKSKDFFSVEEFPTAEFKIIDVIPTGRRFEYTIKGDLTIKGITHPIEFTSLIYSQAGALRAKATTKLDRTLWDIRYGSGKFFENLGDKIIDDYFTVSFDLVAR